MLILTCSQGAGIDLRPMQSIYMFPTLVIFAEGKGIAGARALIEAGSDAHGLDLYFRQDVRLYYRVSLSTRAVASVGPLARADYISEICLQWTSSTAKILSELWSTLKDRLQYSCRV